MGREQRISKDFWECQYCKVGNKSRKIYRPEDVIGHLFIFITKDNGVDCHGPIENTKFMSIAINYLKSITKKHSKSKWQELKATLMSRWSK